MAQQNENKESPPELGEPGQAAAEEAAPAGAVRPKKKKVSAPDAADGETLRDRNRRIREQGKQKRSAKRAAQKRVTKSNLDASEIVDDALARSTHAAAAWLKRHFNVVQWLLVAGLVTWVATEIYSYRVNRAHKKSSDALASAVRAQFGRVGTDEGAEESDEPLPEARETFKTAAARSGAAAKAYSKAVESGSGTALTLAKLGLAGVRYDQRRFADAKAAYQEVKDSPLATQDKDVKARAIEGLGMSLESLGQRPAAEKAFHELENLEVPWFTALGLYHQARVLHADKQDEKAEDLLKKAQAKLESDSEKAIAAGSYLEHAVRELLQTIDPSAVVASPRGFSEEQLRALEQASGSGPGKLTPDKLNELLKQLGQKRGHPAPPASAP